MTIKLPTRQWWTPVVSRRTTDGKRLGLICLFEPSDEEEIKISNTFWQVTKDHESSVLHSKPLRIKAIVVQGEDYQTFYGESPFAQWGYTGILRATPDLFRVDERSCNGIWYDVPIYEDYYIDVSRGDGVLGWYWKPYSVNVQYTWARYRSDTEPRWETGGVWGVEAHQVVLSYNVNPNFACLWYFNEPKVARGEVVFPTIIQQAWYAAFRDAMDQVGHWADNNIANVKDVYEVCRDIVTGAWVDKLPQSIAELWLWYRYAYSTTASDVRQSMENYSRIQFGYQKSARFDGVCSIPSQEAVGEVRIRFRLRRSIDPLKDLHSRLRDAGLDISGFTLWDLVPFSFMVDWFFPVGDWLERQRDKDCIADYVITDCISSVSYTRESESGTAHYYYRWAGPPPEEVEGWYHLNGHSSKGRTWVKRGLDAISIFGSM